MPLNEGVRVKNAKGASMIRRMAAFIMAVAAVVIVGAASLSWFDQAAYLASAGPGATLSLADRFSWFASTLSGLAVGVGMYPGLVAVGLLIAFLAAGLVKSLAPGLRTWWYAGAGAAALIVMVIALELALGLKVLSGARSIAGISGQGVAGFIGGAIFASLTARGQRRRFRH
jgi:hypothetical protein